MQKTHTFKPKNSAWVYLICIGGWLLVCVSVMCFLIYTNIKDAKKELIEYGNGYSNYLNKEMASNEITLKGFSALFAAIGSAEPEKVHQYAKSVITSNNSIYGLEIAQNVHRNHLNKFLASKTENGQPTFKIKSFAYDTGRKWQAVKEQPFYYPIVFIAPLTASSKDVLGLDLTSVPFINKSLMQSVSQRATVATRPFRLIEGPLAFVVFSPIDGQQEFIVDMVVEADKLARTNQFPVMRGWSVLIYHRDFAQHEAKGHLYAKAGPARTRIEKLLFPAFSYHKPLTGDGNTFNLDVKYQTGWGDLNLGLLMVMALLSLLSGSVIYLFLKLNDAHKDNLWLLAHHDHLTGIPNRMQLMDSLRHALAFSERNRKYGALIYLDINNFKHVNDSKGHDEGDLVLQEVAKRLQNCIRDVDTAARLGGDEFAVVLNDLGNNALEAERSAQLVVEKIRQAILAPHITHHAEYRTQISVGVKLFFSQQQSAEDLLKAADTEMYQRKRAHKATIRGDDIA